jgi:hypothetical protein
MLIACYGMHMIAHQQRQRQRRKCGVGSGVHDDVDMLVPAIITFMARNCIQRAN